MFGFLMRNLARFFAQKQSGGAPVPPTPGGDIPKSLEKTLEAIKSMAGDSSDVVIRELKLGGEGGIDVALVYVDGLVNSKLVNDDIIKPLMFGGLKRAPGTQGEAPLSYAEKSLLAIGEIREVSDLKEAVEGFLSGDVAMFVDGSDRAAVMNSKGWDKRSIMEPLSEAAIRGPRESFVESLRTNTSMLRRKIKNPALRMETMVIGRKTRTNVCLAYIDGVAKPELVAEVRRRLEAIDTDSVLESGYIEQYIEDAPGSIFSTVGFTEKPDVAAAKMLEGRVVVLVDGTPFVLTVPFLFIESFQDAEDYYFRPIFATFTRIIRVIAYAITVLAPALYVGITTYHQELIPTSLLITMARAREGVPFPAFVESLIMIVTFEILREAGIRLPRPIGQALSIVGALVIGESAVAAGLISAPMVIVVAITAVSGFLVPNQNDSAASMRLLLLVLSATLGGFGITLGLLFLLVHLSSLESFGYPYFSPIVPFDPGDSKDAVIRAPTWLMISRPKGMSDNRRRSVFTVPPAGSSGN